MSFAEFGEQGKGQPMRAPIKSMITRLMVTHNARGDVMVVRRGEQVAWIDMSRDVAIALVMALIEHAQIDEAVLAMHLASRSEPKRKLIA